MNNIMEKQNEPKYIKYLEAQRQLYDDSKQFLLIWVIAVILIAIVASGIFEVLEPITPYMTLFAFLIMLGEILVVPLINKRQENAAKIQELFDCEVLEMDWNDAIGGKPEQRVITNAANKFEKNSSPERIEKLRNWYTKDIKALPIYQARVICQSENINWDQQLRKEYNIYLSIVLIAILVLLLVVGLLLDWSLIFFFKGPLLFILPIIGYIAITIFNQRKTIQRLEEMKLFINELAKFDYENDPGGVAISQRSRQLQTEVFHHRAENPFVPSQFYNKRRDKYQ